jgi:hypothetical protein
MIAAVPQQDQYTAIPGKLTMKNLQYSTLREIAADHAAIAQAAPTTLKRQGGGSLASMNATIRRIVHPEDDAACRKFNSTMLSI